MPEFTLQLGGEYRTRNGQKVTEIKDDGLGKFKGKILIQEIGAKIIATEAWAIDGGYWYAQALDDHPLDIVGLWYEPTFPDERPRYFADI